MMRVVRIVVQSLIGNTTENHFNFVVAQPLVTFISTISIFVIVGKTYLLRREKAGFRAILC